MRNTYVGWWLAGTGLVVAVAAWGSYAYGRSQWENHDMHVSRALGREAVYNATPFVAAAVVGGVLFMAGVIFLATGDRRD